MTVTSLRLSTDSVCHYYSVRLLLSHVTMIGSPVPVQQDAIWNPDPTDNFQDFGICQAIPRIS
jgi:hypothetical protein